MTQQGRLQAQSLAVVGADYPNKKGPGRRFAIALCRPGDIVDLRPEPDNPADARAIAVFSRDDIQLGYLRAEHAYRLGKITQAGHTHIAIFQEATRYGAAIRVAFDGEHPTLPSATPAADEPEGESDSDSRDEEHVWYPDEDWDEH